MSGDPNFGSPRKFPTLPPIPRACGVTLQSQTPQMLRNESIRTLTTYSPALCLRYAAGKPSQVFRVSSAETILPNEWARDRSQQQRTKADP